MRRTLSVVRNRAVAWWLRRTGQREWTHSGDFGYRILAPWDRHWPEGYFDPTPAEIVALRGWR